MKIYLAGHQGLVGSALLRALNNRSASTIITRTFAQLDLRNQQQVEQLFSDERPSHIYVAAAKVGGIKANSELPASFLYDNIMIASNVMHAAYKYGAQKLLFLGSSCIYPRLCAQPMKEEYLLSGPLEPTNEPYAIAKIAGLKLCQAYNSQYGTRFISAMPTNLYGPHDHFNTESSHVIPALITKFHQAKIEGHPEVVLWGTGRALREFLFVDDLAAALLMLMDQYEENQWINVGSGAELSIAELATLIKQVTGYEGRIVFDSSKPDGTPRKLLCSEKIRAHGWQAQVSLEDGLKRTYDWYLQHHCTAPSFVQLKEKTHVC